MFKRFGLLGLALALMPSVALAVPTKFTNPTTSRDEVNVTGFAPASEVVVTFNTVTKSVTATCLVGSDRYGLLSSDADADIYTPMAAFQQGGGAPAIKVNGGTNLFGDEETVYNARCSFVDGVRRIVAPDQDGKYQPIAPIQTGNLLQFMPFNQQLGSPIPGGKKQMWVRLPSWDPTPIQLVGGQLLRKYKANACGIIRFAETATSALPDSFRINSTTYLVSSLDTAYPPKCYKTGETSYTLFTPAP